MVLSVCFLSDKMLSLLLLAVSVKRQRTMWEGCKHTEISVVISETVKTGGTRVPVMKEFILSQYMRCFCI